MAEMPPDKQPKPDEKAPGAGDYGLIIGKQAVQTEAIYTSIGKAAAVVTVTAPLTPVFQTVARRAPLIGAVISAGQAITEVGTDIKESKYAKASVATVAGAVEVVGNLFGFGVGDSAREMVRSAAIKLGGEEVAVEKSDLRNASETVGTSLRIQKEEAAQEDLRLRNAVKLLVEDGKPQKVPVTNIFEGMSLGVAKPPKR